ncbi:hypothetical protein CHUAL_008819 [Chamberlinius hualienensis]
MHFKQIAIFICLFSFWDLMEAGLFDDLFYKTVDNNCTRAVPSLPLEDFIRPAYITGWTYPESRCGSIVISKYGTAINLKRKARFTFVFSYYIGHIPKLEMSFKPITTLICFFVIWNQMEAGLFNGLFYKSVDNNCTRAVPYPPLEDFTRSAYVVGWTYPPSRCGYITISKFGIFGLIDLYFLKLQYYQLNDTTNSNPLTETLLTVENPNKKWEFESLARRSNNKILHEFSVNDVIVSNSQGFTLVSCPLASINTINGAIVTYTGNLTLTEEYLALTTYHLEQSINVTYNSVTQDETCPNPWPTN